ncbi:MAG: hypothetical protein HC788_00930 [Sphingopyxis sp.]|nr:hypothetical protein [Sphingopyxis sp.]
MKFTAIHIIALTLSCSAAVVEASDNPDLRHPAGTVVGPRGAIIFDPAGNRKTYLPVAQIMVPKQFLGAWAAAEEGYDATPMPVIGEKQTEGTKTVITTRISLPMTAKCAIWVRILNKRTSGHG